MRPCPRWNRTKPRSTPPSVSAMRCNFPPAVYDVSESTVSVDGGTLKLTAKRLSTPGSRLSSRTSRTAASERIPDMGNPWVPAGSHPFCRYLLLNHGRGRPPCPHPIRRAPSSQTWHPSRSTSKTRKSGKLKRKDDGKKGEHGGIGTTATRSSIIEGLKPVWLP